MYLSNGVLWLQNIVKGDYRYMKRDLHVCIGSNTKAIKILDEFEGLDGGKPYKGFITPIYENIIFRQ